MTPGHSVSRSRPPPAPVKSANAHSPPHSIPSCNPLCQIQTKSQRAQLPIKPPLGFLGHSRTPQRQHRQKHTTPKCNTSISLLHRHSVTSVSPPLVSKAVLSPSCLPPRPPASASTRAHAARQGGAAACRVASMSCSNHRFRLPLSPCLLSGEFPLSSALPQREAPDLIHLRRCNTAPGPLPGVFT